MKKTGLVLLMLLMISTTLFAQPGKYRERIKALKIAYITEKLNLSSKQAEQFWPVYNEYEAEMWKTRKGFIDKYRSDNPGSDPKSAHQYIEANLDFQEKIIDLKKKYKDKFLEVISAQQVAELYEAEHGFKQMLLRELKERRNERGRGVR